MGVEGAVCVVTGGSGLAGRRLVEMLAEKGAARVVSFDIAPKPVDAMEHPAIEYQQVGVRRVRPLHASAVPGRPYAVEGYYSSSRLKVHHRRERWECTAAIAQQYLRSIL